MRLRLPLLAVATAGALLAGCTATPTDDGVDTPDPSTDTTSSAGGGSAPACAAASAAVIKSTLNVDVSEPTQTDTGDVIVCNYLPANGGFTVIVRFQTGRDKAAFARGREGFDSTGQPTTDVPGLFDEAYVCSAEFDNTVTNTMVARRGSVEMLVTAVASVEAEKALVTKVIGSLG